MLGIPARLQILSSLIAIALLGSALSANALDAPKADAAKPGMPVICSAR